MLLVAATAFMEILDGTILATAAPAMARSFDVQSSAISLAITSYLITLAVLIPISGWLCDRWGTRTVYVAAIVVFTLGSALCASSTGLLELTVLRVVQGAGAAMMVPVGRLVVLRAMPRAGVVRAVAFLTWPSLVAPILAPLVGGWFVSYASWRWIFLINVPLGVVAAVLALRLVPQRRQADRRGLDWLGFALCTLASSAIVATAELLRETHSAVVADAAVAGIALVAAVTAAHHLLSVRGPLLDLRLFAVATFRVAHIGGSVLRMTVSAVPFLLPLLFQDGLGWTPIRAGSIVLWLFVGNLGIKPATTLLLRRLGFRVALAGSALVAAGTMALIATIDRHTSMLAVAALLVVSGAARSMGMTALNTVTFADVSDRQMTPANTLSATLTQLALGLGVALGAVCLRLGASVTLGLNGALAPYRVAFILLALITVLPVLDALGLDRRAGQALLRRT